MNKMKIKLVPANNDGDWDWDNAFEIKLPFIPQVGMMINLSTETRYKWEKMIYNSENYKDYCPRYVYRGSKENKISDEHSLSSKQCRERTILEEDATFPSTSDKCYFSTEDIGEVEHLSYNEEENTMYVVLKDL